MIRQDNNQKHEDALYQGPFTISRVYDIGTVDLKQQTLCGGVLTQ